jgi:hypothetical protein
METLLVAAIIITALAIVVQAGVLVSMYLMSKEVTRNVDGLISESRRLLVPMEQVTQNVKSASDDLVVVGKIARDQMNHVALIVEDTHVALTSLTSDVSNRVMQTVDEVKSVVDQPIRQWGALFRGITVGLRTLVRREESQPQEIREIPDIRQFPAA